MTSRKPRAVVVDGQLVIERPRRRRLGRAYLNLRLAAARGGLDEAGPMGAADLIFFAGTGSARGELGLGLGGRPPHP